MTATRSTASVCRLTVSSASYGLLGSAISVILASAAAVWTPPHTLRNMVPRANDLGWGAAVPSGWPRPTSRTVYSSAVHTCILEQTISYTEGGLVDPGASHSAWIFRFGWPVRTLQLELRLAGTGNPQASGSFDTIPTWLKPTDSSPRQWPLRPLPSGLLFNSLFFGACAWLIHRGSREVVAWWRVRSGRCPVCSYACAPPSGCSECGWRRPTSKGASERS